MDVVTDLSELLASKARLGPLGEASPEAAGGPGGARLAQEET
jgi:hypothetical protein